MRTESSAKAVRARTVYSDKTILAFRARARKTMVNMQIFTVRMLARNVISAQYLCSARAHEPQRPKTCSAPCAYTDSL